MYVGYRVQLKSWTRMTDGYLHQQAGLTAGTVTYNDKFSTDFRHREGMWMEKGKGATWSIQMLSRGVLFEARVRSEMEIRQLVVERLKLRGKVQERSSADAVGCLRKSIRAGRWLIQL